MSRLLIVVLFFLIGAAQGFSQSLVQTYTDRCTGNVKVFSVEIGSSTVVTFYNRSRVFTSSEFQNGTLQTWLEETYSWWSSLSPCSQNQAGSTSAQNTANNATNNATNAATNASSGATNSSTNATGNTNSSGSTGSSTNTNQNNNNSNSTNSSSSSNNSGGDSSNQGSDSSGSSGSKTGSSEDSSSNSSSDSSSKGDKNSSNDNEGNSNSGDEKDSSSSESSENNDSSESENSEGSEKSDGEDDGGEETGNEDDSDSGEESEEEVEEESSEEESSEEEEESSEEESSDEEEESSEEEEEEEESKLAPPIISANVVSMQMLDGSLSNALSIGYSQSSLTGIYTYTANSMIWDNLQQYGLNLSVSKASVLPYREYEILGEDGKWYTRYEESPGKVYKITSYSASFLKMFGTNTYSAAVSEVFLGKAGLIYGWAFSNLFIGLDTGTIFSPNLTLFGTKPYKITNRINSSPMLALSSSPFFINFDTGEFTPGQNSTYIVGVNNNLNLTQRFILNLGINIIGSTDSNIPITWSATIGSRFSF
tara:strand:- start:294 stop:1904 length:1611 start_codon:yes stop_codon:yes gene_type:complete